VIQVAIRGDVAEVQFGRFDLEAYETFLRCKKLPESALQYDWERDTYTLTTPARFASLIDASVQRLDRPEIALAGHLFDYQQYIVETALAAQRYAIWADTGLGKTAMFLEWGRQVAHRTAGRVLIFSPLQIIEQTRAEAERFYGGTLPIQRLETREALAAWCKGEQPASAHFRNDADKIAWVNSGGGGPGGCQVAICNPEKMIAGVLPELRYLGGLVVDESSFLKSGGGVIKWNLIKSARGIEYKLSSTATPAPNDTMEYASQASFLEKLRTEGEILWTYFTRDKAGNWRVKPHAKEAFYRFMASWSIYLRDPAHYGWGDILSTLPPPEIHEHAITLTDEQRTAMQAIQTRAGVGMLSDRVSATVRQKLSEVAKGFIYETGPSGRSVRRIDSRKPAFVADLVRQEVAAGRQTIVWTVFDEESVLIEEALRALDDGTRPSSEVLHGSTPDADRQLIIDEFKDDAFDVLITKAELVGRGLNFQNCRAMVFSGFDDSFERMYQAIRRAYRYGQTETVHVHVPYITELEGMIFDNVQAKQRRFDQETAECEAAYRKAMGRAA